jgi:U3 small nucleolar RNA-associated protein 25
LKAVQKHQWTTQKMILPNCRKATASLPQSGDARVSSSFPTATGPGDLKLKKKLADIVAKQRPSFDSLESYLAPMIFSYQDVLFCERTTTNQESLHRLTCLHTVNHIFK